LQDLPSLKNIPFLFGTLYLCTMDTSGVIFLMPYFNLPLDIAGEIT
jgi:hypothetical protein